MKKGMVQGAGNYRFILFYDWKLRSVSAEPVFTYSFFQDNDDINKTVANNNYLKEWNNVVW